MADLRVILNLFTGKFDLGLANATRSVQNFLRNTSKMGKQIASSLNFTGINTAALLNPYSAAGAAIGVTVGNIVKHQVLFEKSMKNFQAVLGINTDEMQYFEQEAIRMGSVTTQTASLVADAFTMIAGRLPQLLEAKEGLVAVTLAAITLAEAAGITVDMAGKALADSINQTGASAYDAERYINVLAAGSRNGAANIEYLNLALEKFGSIGSTVGMSFEQLVAAIETVAPKVTEASSAGIYLRSVLLTLEKQNDNNLKPSVVGLSKALENLAAKQLTIAEYAQMFDKRAVITIQTLVNEREKFEDLTEAVTDTNTAYDLAVTRTDNVKGAMTRLSSAWEEFTLSIKDSTGFVLDFLDGLALSLGNVTDLYLKLADAEAYEAKKAGEAAEAKRKYDVDRLNDIIKSTQYTVNPATGLNYTEKEAAKLLKSNYKEYFVELKVIDTDTKVLRDNAINAYLDDIINKLEKLKLIQKEEAITNELKIAQLKKQLELTTDNVERAAILQQIKDLGGSTKGLNKELVPVGSLAELDKQISAKKTELGLAINKNDRIRIQKEIDELTNKKRTIELDVKYGRGLELKVSNNPFDTSYKDIHSKIKIKNPIKKQDIKQNNDYADSLNAITNVMGVMADMTNEGAAAWLTWAGSLMTATATAVEAIRNVVTAKTAEAAASGAAEAAKTPFVGWLMVGGAIASVLAAFAALPSFSTGGIYAGNSTIGDMNLARVNAGEMILNNRQQRNLFNLLNGNGTLSGNNGGNVTFKIQGKELVGVLNNYNNQKSKVR